MHTSRDIPLTSRPLNICGLKGRRERFNPPSRPMDRREGEGLALALQVQRSQLAIFG